MPVNFLSKQVLKALTIEGAKVLGMDEEIGSLEVGKQADFLVIQPQGKIHLQPRENMLSHLVYAVNLVMLMMSILPENRLLSKVKY